MADEDGPADFEHLEEPRKPGHCLVVHEVRRTRPGQRVRFAVTAAVVDERAASEPRAQLRGKVPPLADRAEPFVQEHQCRRLRGRRAVPRIFQSCSVNRDEVVHGSRYDISVLALPDTFNAATWFVDRNVHEGRGAKVAIECADERVTYRQLLERVNRTGNALRGHFDVRIEERIVLLLLDGPEFIYTFFGAIKIGAVPIPTSTLWKPADYEYLLNDSRARVAVVSEALLPSLRAIPR